MFKKLLILDRKIKFQINSCLEDLFFTKNKLITEKLITLMYCEALIAKLQIQYFVNINNVTKIPNQDLVESLIRIIFLSKLQQSKFFPKKKFFNRVIVKVRPSYSGYSFFKSMVQIFNKGGQLQKSSQKVLTGILETRRLMETKQFKKTKLTYISSLIVKKINPLYFNRRFNLGRKTFIIPGPLFNKKKKLFAARWLKKALKKKREIFLKKFPQEIFNIFKGTGETLKYKKANKMIATINLGNITRKFRKRKRR